MRPLLRPTLLVAAIAFAPALEAQSLPREPGLVQEGELWIGVGGAYRALFDTDGFTLHPALGRSSPETRALSLRLESIRVGESSLPLDLGAPPSVAGLTVRYERSSAVSEHYELSWNGVEQFFVLDELPDVRGALEIRLRLESTLELPRGIESHSGLVARAEPHGRVHVSNVVGIDAAGRTQDGSLRLTSDGGALELLLPASFMETAVAPLVVDPVFMPEIDLDPGATDSVNVDVAFEGLNFDRYSTVWERWYSSFDSDILAQRYEASGVPYQGLHLLEVSPDTYSQNPTAGFFTNVGTAVFAWQQASQPFGPFQIAARIPGAEAGLLSEAGSNVEPRIGSQSKSGVSRAHVVWKRVGRGIQSALIGKDVNNDVFPVDPITITNDDRDGHPEITRGAGESRRHMVVWQRDFTSDHDVMFTVLDIDNEMLMTPQQLGETLLSNEEDPHVAGDGESFFVTYSNEPLFEAGDRRIAGKRVDIGGTGSVGTVDLLGEEVTISTIPGVDEFEPAVALAGSKYLVAWSRAIEGTLLEYAIDFVGLDAQSGAVCDPVTALAEGPGQGNRKVALASQRALDSQAAPGEDLVGVVWSNIEPQLPFDSEVHFAQLDAVGPGSPLLDLGGGCGNPGTISTDGAFAIGSQDFTVNLSTTNPLVQFAVLNGSPLQPTLSCGSCDWLPLVYASSHDVFSGNVSVTLPIPCDPTLEGVPFLFQWTVLYDSGTGCLLPEISMTDILQGTLEF